MAKKETPVRARVDVYTLKDWRVRVNGESLRDMADRTNLSISYISQLENGKITASLRTAKVHAERYAIRTAADFMLLWKQGVEG